MTVALTVALVAFLVALVALVPVTCIRMRAPCGGRRPEAWQPARRRAEQEGCHGAIQACRRARPCGPQSRGSMRRAGARSRLAQQPPRGAWRACNACMPSGCAHLKRPCPAPRLPRQGVHAGRPPPGLSRWGLHARSRVQAACWQCSLSQELGTAAVQAQQSFAVWGCLPLPPCRLTDGAQQAHHQGSGNHCFHDCVTRGASLHHREGTLPWAQVGHQVPHHGASAQVQVQHAQITRAAQPSRESRPPRVVKRVWRAGHLQACGGGGAVDGV
jgi:hypothetical protein